ncbi:MAG: GDSL-type esterase/lipase family protein [Selenomonadaceae bacterium]|nr:GDSL-type esterase/lipase family protein [Selenomonadaceae bacterium]
MKKFLSFVFVITVFFLAFTYAIEKSGMLFLGRTTANAVFTETPNGQVLSWDKLPYPCYYRIDTISISKGRGNNQTERRIEKSEFSMTPSCKLESSAVPTEYIITPYGMFGTFERSFDPVVNPRYEAKNVPVLISSFTKDTPASAKPFLLWHTVPTAACYRLELLSDKPSTEGGTAKDSDNSLYITERIYTNGCQVDLTDFMKGKGKEIKKFYWRVLALNLDREPLGEFSPASELFADSSLPYPDRPMLNENDKMITGRMPLYPVYNWIPLADRSLDYEVELSTRPYDKEHKNKPIDNPLWRKSANEKICLYDDLPRGEPGTTYYWRVRALDREGNQVGHYSDVAAFSIPLYEGRPFAAAFGDSITHGGGAISYSPANLEYSYTSYLDFPTINLGKSGDTLDAALARFENDVLPLHPYNLLIMEGTNNLRNDMTAADMCRYIDDIRSVCEKNDIRPIFMTIMPLNPPKIMRAFNSATNSEWNQKLKIVNDHIRTMPYYIELEPYFYDQDNKLLAGELAIDGLHPDVSGKMLMANIVNKHKHLLRQ